MTTPAESLRTLESCFAELEALTTDLSDAEWSHQSLCPDWTVRGVVEHLGSLEHVLSGWFPSSGTDPLPFDRLGEFTTDVARLSNDQLRARLAELLNRRRSELRSLDDEQWATDSPSPIGPTTYQGFMDVRIFDFWVHQQDMTIPLGRPADRRGAAAELSLDRMRSALGFIVGKNIGLADGESITFRLTGPIETSLHVLVDGRAAVVEDLSAPTAELVTDSTTFLMLGCGRLDPVEEIARGTVRWTGDPAIGERAAHGLRFVTF